MQRGILGWAEGQAPHSGCHMGAMPIAVLPLAARLQGGVHLICPAACAAVQIPKLLVCDPDALRMCMGPCVGAWQGTRCSWDQQGDGPQLVCLYACMRLSACMHAYLHVWDHLHACGHLSMMVHASPVA